MTAFQVPVVSWRVLARVWVVELVELHVLGRRPGQGDFAVRVTGDQAGAQSEPSHRAGRGVPLHEFLPDRTELAIKVAVARERGEDAAGGVPLNRAVVTVKVPLTLCPHRRSGRIPNRPAGRPPACAGGARVRLRAAIAAQAPRQSARSKTLGWTPMVAGCRGSAITRPTVGSRPTTFTCHLRYGPDRQPGREDLALAESVEALLTNIRNWVMGILAALATVFFTIGGVGRAGVAGSIDGSSVVGGVVWGGWGMTGTTRAGYRIGCRPVVVEAGVGGCVQRPSRAARVQRAARSSAVVK
jgi:hypothetical protein